MKFVESAAYIMIQYTCEHCCSLRDPEEERKQLSGSWKLMLAHSAVESVQHAFAHASVAILRTNTHIHTHNMHAAPGRLEIRPKDQETHP